MSEEAREIFIHFFADVYNRKSTMKNSYELNLYFVFILISMAVFFFFSHPCAHIDIGREAVE